MNKKMALLLINPVSGGNQYEVRALSAGKSGTWTTEAALDDIWIQISANRTWGVTATGAKLTSATFEIGPDGTSTADDDGFIQCEVTNV